MSHEHAVFGPYAGSPCKLFTFTFTVTFLQVVPCCVHPPGPVHLHMGKPSPSSLVLREILAASCSLVVFVPGSSRLRLTLFCTCTPLRAGALWLMPVWVWFWRAARCVLSFYSCS